VLSSKAVRWTAGWGVGVVVGTAWFVACSSSSDPPAVDPTGGGDDPSEGGAIVLPDGAVLLPDGAIVQPDGGPIPDGSTVTDTGPDVKDSGPVITYKNFDINHVISTGASDSVANGASPTITKTQPFTNLSFNVGVMTGRGTPGNPAGACNGIGCTQYENPNDFIPLIEDDRFLGFKVETMSSGLANQASVFATGYFAKVGLPYTSHDVLVSVHGRSGVAMSCLWKVYCDYEANPGYLSPFGEGMMQVQSAKTIAAAKGKTYVVRAVTIIHGQSDHDSRETELIGNGVPTYAAALIKMQQEYETSVQAITGQAEPVPLFVSQFGSFTAGPIDTQNNVITSVIPVRQLAAHVQAKGKIFVVTPNYPFQHYPDCNHYHNYSERRLGAYFAKAYNRVIVEGVPWEPLRPISITRANNVLTIKYHVPVPPMVLDTTRVLNPGNYGFTFQDSTASASITSVALAGPDTVTLTLSNAPTGANPKLRYALNMPTVNQCPGPTFGGRGNFRDSDPTVPDYNDNNGADDQPQPLFNWSVAYELDVP